MLFHYRTPFLISFLFLLTNCSDMATNTYEVLKITNGQIKVDGSGSDPKWEKAIPLNDFQYPWREETPPETTFKALWDEEKLYLLYRADDPEIITKKEGLGERDVVNSDRVEIFFKADDQMNPYYALELDALGRVLDTEGRYHRNIDYHWNWPAGHLVVKASIDDDGYWVEASISFASLHQLGMWKPGQSFLKAGLYRGEYTQDEAGKTIVKWISWVKPDSPTPDFHIPSSFGQLDLSEKTID